MSGACAPSRIHLSTRTSGSSPAMKRRVIWPGRPATAARLSASRPRAGSRRALSCGIPDPACNPYLALAVCLAAGLDGIKNKSGSRRPRWRKISLRWTRRHGRKTASPASPARLKRQSAELKKDELIKETLGDHVLTQYILGKAGRMGRIQDESQQLGD